MASESFINVRGRGIFREHSGSGHNHAGLAVATGASGGASRECWRPFSAIEIASMRFSPGVRSVKRNSTFRPGEMQFVFGASERLHRNYSCARWSRKG
jgi:hypothetical protein